MKCSSMEASLSSQGAEIASRSTILQQGYKMCLQDLYDKESNQQGFINLGTSENKICFDLLHDRLTKPDMNYLEPSLLEYHDTRGIKSLREEVAQFLSHYCRAPAPLSPDNVIIMNGSRSIFCALSNVILNPGDGFLIPTPYFALIKDFMSTYTRAHPVEVPLCSKITETESHPFQLTIMKLENAIKKGMKEDFAMSGMAAGVLYTKNQHVLKSMTYLGLFHQCSGPTQHVISRLLSDREWLDGTFFPINKQRLKASQLILVNGLQELGIPVLRSSAGLYVWADFRKFLTSQTFEAEMELWWTFLREKLYIAPGKAFECCEPGWFRLTFSVSHDILEKCIMKLRKLLQEVPDIDLKK
uniref:Aminotransferase class I/classII large domain-containing protein n=1 Tax=Leptobrachium leishanense TaxID=445787 RepID=A0A8C5Q9D2_9ANUR